MGLYVDPSKQQEMLSRIEAAINRANQINVTFNLRALIMELRLS